MSNAIDNVISVKLEDLSTPSSTAQYPLGHEVSIIDSNGILQTYKYVKAAAGLTAGGAYVIEPDLTAVRKTAVPATSAVAKEFGFAPVAFTINYYGFLLVEGKITNAASAGATASGNTCSLANGVITVTDETGAVETAKTVGILGTTAIGAGTVTVLVKRKSVTI